MGTNYYMRTKNKEVAERYAAGSYRLIDWGYEFHIAKTSMGWLPLFQEHTGVHCVIDLLSAYLDGCEIFDEYGDQFNWCTFKHKVIDHNGGTRSGRTIKEVESLDPDMPPWVPVSHLEFANGRYYNMYVCDPQGYEFTKGEFQ